MVSAKVTRAKITTKKIENVNLLYLSFFGVFHNDLVIKLSFKLLLSDYPQFLKLLRWPQISGSEFLIQLENVLGNLEEVFSQTSASKTGVYGGYGKSTVRPSLKTVFFIVITYSTSHAFCVPGHRFQPNNVLLSHFANVTRNSLTSYQYIINLRSQGKSSLKSTSDSLFPVTHTGTAGFTERNSTSVHHVHITNLNDLLSQAHPSLPPSFRYPAQRSLSVPQKIIPTFYFRYVYNNSGCTNVEFIKQLPVCLSRYDINAISIISNLVYSHCDLSDFLNLLTFCSQFCRDFLTGFELILNNYPTKKTNFLKTKYSLLMTVHPNPGPDSEGGRGGREVKIKMLTFNVNGGLHDELKSKRLVNKLIKDNKSEHPTIIALQETHLTVDRVKSFDNKWRYQSVHSFFTQASAGVAILYFAHQWAEVLEERTDGIGRICSLTVKSSNDEKFTFLSIYVPSSSRSSLEFIDSIETYCNEILRTYPDTQIFLLGDFNYTTDNNDYTTRTVTPVETLVRLKMLALTQTFKLKDSYRQVSPKGGFTWGHRNSSNLRSRIDRIFVPEELEVDESSVVVDFDQSDHSLLITRIKLKTLNNRGPGCYKINPLILDNEYVKKEIEMQITSLMESVPVHFDPHLKWDYIKMGIRNIFMNFGSSVSKSNKFELECVEKELNMLHSKLDHLLTDGSLESDDAVRILKLEIKRCNEIVDKQRDLEAKNLIYFARAKWAEEGEKSTKYFLNLIKTRAADSTISSIKTQNGVVTEQKDIENEIHRFYKDLYESKLVSEEEELNAEFLADLPKIPEDSKISMDTPLTLLDLYNAVQSCKDSAPGPDAIPYSIYKHFWNLLGSPLLDSWRYSLSIGKLSQDQRQSIITLIPKKDKDRSILSNLRPISLTNTDVKIITKAITIKINPILEHIISPTQTGYVPKRQVTDNNFLLDKIIQLANRMQENLFILSLDAKKAFDSVDHKYMYKTLKAFGFGDDFIFSIQTIYKDLTASVLVNGYKTSIIRLLRGVKQGDALSCALFIICVEPFFRAIQATQSIKGLEIRSPYSFQQVECKLAGYADDFTPIVANINSVNEVFKLYHKFSSISGIYLNPEKTEILKVGPHSDGPESEIMIQYGQDSYQITTSKRIVVCGVSHPISDPDSYKFNIFGKINKMKQLLNSWRCRSLSIMGKILITKVFGLSQLIYFLQTCSITNDDLKCVESALYSFIWSAKSPRPNDKIKRSVLKGPISEGGLNAPDIFSLNRALKFKKWLRTTNNLKHPVSVIQDRLLFLEGIPDKFPQVVHKQILTNVSCQFYRLALDTNNLLSEINYRQLHINHARNEVESEQLTFIASHPIASSIYTWNKPNRAQLLRRTSLLGIANLGALVTFHKENSHGLAWLEIQQCLKSFPKMWITLLNERADWRLNSYTNESLYIGNNKWIHGANIPSRHIRLLLSKQSCTPVEKFDLINKHQLDHECPSLESTPNNPFEIKYIKSTYLKTLHYKILHKAFTTRSKLFLYKVIDTPLCPFCEEEDDNLKHALCSCELSKITWSNFQHWLNKYNIDIQIQIPNIIFGINEKLVFGPLLNTIMLQIKLILLSPKQSRRALSVEEIDKIVIEQLKTEKMFSSGRAFKVQSTAKKIQFEKRWGHLLHFLDA